MRLSLFFVLLSITACDSTDRSDLDNPEPLIVVGTETWGPDPIRLDRDLIIRGTLTIQPGTTIKVIRGSEVALDPAGDVYRDPLIFVEGGSLLAVGSEDAPIQFTLTGHSPYGGEGGHVSIHIDARNTMLPSRIAWVNLPGSLRWEGGSMSVLHTALRSLDLNYPDSLAAEFSEMGSLWILSHESTGPALQHGLVENNRIESLSVVGDKKGRLIIRRNTITSPVYCGLFSHGSTSTVEQNDFEQCTTGFELRGTGTAPRFSENNFTGQDRALVLLPWTHEQDTGIVDARNNWWDTTNLEAIRSRIVYEANGGNTSQREVLIDPIAQEPFER